MYKSLLLEEQVGMSGGYGTDSTAIEISNFGMTLVACALTCIVNAQCLSIFYNRQTPSCRINKKFYNSMNNLVMEENWKYYQPYPFMKVTVYIQTGNIYWAGTDAKVYIKIIGSGLETSSIYLEDSTSDSDLFEKGRLDVFQIETANVGQILQVKLWQDGSGFMSGWFVDYFRITSSNPVIDKTFTVNGNVDEDGYTGVV